ncbi:MAG TPA: hypothetical protein VF785_20745 [Gemmatimonadaceae bacterium]
MTETTAERTRSWQAVDPNRGRDLVDARLQLHHAAQLATAFGISYLAAQADDSHTNLEWIESIGALASKSAGSPAVRVAVRPNALAILILDANANVTATYLLDGRTISDAAEWIRGQLTERGFDAARYTLKRHYQIPTHALDSGAAFRASQPALFGELARWYSNAAATLEQFASVTPNAAPVRCWPHHFDIATIVEVAQGKTVGLGMEPGDEYWQEPYFYTNMYPSPNADVPRPELGGNGLWNTRDWVGAVLPSSRLGTTNQHVQVDDFIRTAVSACKRILLGG